MLCSQPDLRVVEVKDYINRPKLNGYQSLHVILQVPVFLSNRTEFVYVEVQIRTVAMDFWASLEHKIYYTYEGEVPSEILDELRDAAEKASALDAQMADIRDKVTALRQQAPRADEPDPAQWFSDEGRPVWNWEDIDPTNVLGPLAPHAAPSRTRALPATLGELAVRAVVHELPDVRKWAARAFRPVAPEPLMRTTSPGRRVEGRWDMSSSTVDQHWTSEARCGLPRCIACMFSPTRCRLSR